MERTYTVTEATPTLGYVPKKVDGATVQFSRRYWKLGVAFVTPDAIRAGSDPAFGYLTTLN